MELKLYPWMVYLDYVGKSLLVLVFNHHFSGVFFEEQQAVDEFVADYDTFGQIIDKVRF